MNEVTNDIDITSQVRCDFNDGELLPLLKCACGLEHDYWEFSISMDREDPVACPGCKRQLYFRVNIRVYEKKGAN